MSGTPRGEADEAFAQLAAFISEIPMLPWFAAAGATLTPSAIADAESYVAALGLAPCPVAPVAGWRAAADIAQRPDWSRDWWHAENAHEKALHRRGAARFGLAPLLAALTDVTETAAVLRDRAADGLGRAGVDDEALAKVAGGAAAQACHQQALALLTGSDTGRAFGAKYALFAAGHWPLGIVGGTCFVF